MKELKKDFEFIPQNTRFNKDKTNEKLPRVFRLHPQKYRSYNFKC